MTSKIPEDGPKWHLVVVWIGAVITAVAGWLVLYLGRHRAHMRDAGLLLAASGVLCLAFGIVGVIRYRGLIRLTDVALLAFGVIAGGHGVVNCLYASIEGPACWP